VRNSVIELIFEIVKFGFSENEEKYHEAQKPLALIEFLINLTTKENQIVLDSFMGSGTTVVASKNLVIV
jgi:site-specific DNA-methyltransferase (adenine-specific)